jgi:hypothetical protein
MTMRKPRQWVAVGVLLAVLTGGAVSLAQTPPGETTRDRHHTIGMPQGQVLSDASAPIPWFFPTQYASEGPTKPPQSPSVVIISVEKLAQLRDRLAELSTQVNDLQTQNSVLRAENTDLKTKLEALTPKPAAGAHDK